MDPILLHRLMALHSRQEIGVSSLLTETRGAMRQNVVGIRLGQEEEQQDESEAREDERLVHRPTPCAQRNGESRQHRTKCRTF